MISIVELLKIKKIGDKTVINEKALNRLYASKTSFAVISAWSPELSPEKNAELLLKIEKFIKNNQLRAIRLNLVSDILCGESKPHSPKENGNLRPMTHPGIYLCIPGITLPIAKAISCTKQFHQESVIYSGPETKGSLVEISPNGNIKYMTISDGKINQMNPITSQENIHLPLFKNRL